MINDTVKSRAFFLEKGLDYIFCNEDIEPTFERNQLNEITDRWNNRISVHEIAADIKRDPDEVFLAIFHQARAGKIKRMINVVESVKHVKQIQGVPVVIMYDGRRYVHEPKG